MSLDINLKKYFGLSINITIVLLFLIGMCSAMTFDNRVRKITNKVVIIDDNLGFGGDLVKVELIDNTDRCLTKCYSTWNVTIYKGEDDFLDLMDFEGIDGKNKEINYKFEISRGYEERARDVYEDVCVGKGNSTICSKKKTRTETYEEEIWEDFNPKKKLEEGNYKIRLIGNKESYQSVDWKPTFYGKKINEWSWWIGVAPTAYYEFESNLEDTTNNGYDLTAGTGNSYAGSGKLGSNSRTLAGTTADFITGESNFTFGTNNFTIAFWMNTSSLGTNDAIISSAQDASAQDYSYTLRESSGNLIFRNDGGGSSDICDFGSTSAYENGRWQRVVIVREGTGAGEIKCYVNGTLIDTGQYNGDNLDDNLYLGNGTYSGYTGQVDELLIYNNFTWTSADVTTDWNSGSGLSAGSPDSLAIVNVINLDSPENTTRIVSSTMNFSASLSTLYANITNYTFSLYYSNSTLSNQNITIVTGLSNSTNITLSGLDVNQSYVWNVYMCADNSTSTKCDSASSNYTLNLLAMNQTWVSFENETLEGTTNQYYSNISTASTISLSSVTMYYNNSGYSSDIDNVGNNTYAVSNSVASPSVSAAINISFYWNMTFSNGLIVKSDDFKSQVNPLSVDNCSLYSNQIINFSLVDEEFQGSLENGTIETAVSLYNSGRSNLILNLSGSYSSNPLYVCLSENFTNSTQYYLDVVVRYEAPESAIEYYNIYNSSLNINTSNRNITLYDLNSSDSTDFQLTFTGSDYLPVEDALVYLDRQYISENVFKTVELPKTDNNGQTVLHMVRNDVIYNIRVIKEGEVLGSFENIVAYCDDYTIGDCKISLDAISNTTAIFDYQNSLGVSFSKPTYDNSTDVLSVQFSSYDGSTKTVLMNVTRVDEFGNRTICQDSLTSSSGTLSCSVNPNIEDTDLRVNVYVDGNQVSYSSVKIDPSNYGYAGLLVFFIMTLFFILMFSESKTLLLLGLGINFIGGLLFGLLSGTIIGVGASGIWLIIVLLVGIWKLNKEKVQE